MTSELEPNRVSTPRWLWVLRGCGLVLWIVVLIVWIQARTAPRDDRRAAELPTVELDWGPAPAMAQVPTKVPAEDSKPASVTDAETPTNAVEKPATREILIDPTQLPLQPANQPVGPKWDPNGVADFEFTDQSSRKVTKADLLGKPWIVAFIFTKCLGPCPRITQQMRKLQDVLKKDDVKLVSITVDPARDTPAALKEYAELNGADHEKWLFLSGDRNDTYRLIQQSFRMPVMEEEGPNRKPGFEVLHSVNILLVDAQGVVLAKYDGREDRDMVSLRRQVRQLLKQPTTVEDAEEQAAEKAAQQAASKPAGKPIVEAEELPVAPDWVLRLPHVNAGLNASATLLLILGFVLIKARQVTAHKWTMLTAFAMSCLFLACYLTYHQALHYYTGQHGKPYPGSGAMKLLYFAVLIPHVILAVPVPVLAIITMRLGFQQNWPAHRRWAWITWPIWLYVSVTGVIIYGMLYL